jgi:serine/threonine-protein kinase
MTDVRQTTRVQYDGKVEPTPAPPASAVRRARREHADGGVTARQSKELCALLRRRILISDAVMVAFFGILPISGLMHMYDADVSIGARQVLVMQLITAAILGVIGAILWWRPPKGLTPLRWFEALVFGIGVVTLAVSNAYFIERWELLKPPIPVVRHSILDLAGSALDPVSMRWLLMVVGYGTLIPNTWRRCATVVFGMVALYLGFLVIQGSANGATASEIGRVLRYPVVWMTIGSIIAIFGSYRTGLLERRVQEVERFGQYRLKRHLGTGGMADVYLAEHVLLKRPFAVKLLSPEHSKDEMMLQRFEREVKAMSRLEHWNAVAIYDYGHAADGSFYYVMEYLPGLTLQQMVTGYGPLPAARAIHFVRQLCGALHEAHGMGLMHRDVKPQNIIICERAGIFDVAKLLDFGLVKHVGFGEDTQLTVEGTIAGTPLYMSPEQASGSDPVDGRSDIYSLGAVAYFLLTGRPPFEGGNAMHVMVAHVSEDPAPIASLRADIDPQLAAIVHRCLAKKAADRYATAKELADALGQCTSCGTWRQLDAQLWWKGVPVVSV